MLSKKYIERTIKTQVEYYCEEKALNQKIESIILSAIGQINSANVPSDADVKAEIEQAQASAEIAKQLALKEIKDQTDRQLLEARHEAAEAENERQADEYEDSWALKDELKQNEMKKHGVTQPMLDAARAGTLLYQEVAEEGRKTADAIDEANSAADRAKSSSSQQPSGSGTYYTTGGNKTINLGALLGGMDTSNLAREGTLRGIYELLNGGAPVGGWSDSISEGDKMHDNNTGDANVMASGIKDQMDLSVKSFGAYLENLGSSVGKFVKDVKNRPYENMAYFNDEKHVGRYLKGDQNAIDAKRIKNFLGNHKKDNLKLALHNHPDGISALSPADIGSAILHATEYGVGAFGSVTTDKITGVDFSDISKEIGLKILNAYKENIKNSKFKDLFDDEFEIKPEFANLNDESKQEVGNELNRCLVEAITNANLNPDDIFGQINVSDLDESTKKVVETVIENAGEAV